VEPLAKLLEAALFAASRPLTLEELASLEPESGESAVRAALGELRAAYGDAHGVELAEIAEGWQFLTRREYAEVIDRAQFALRPRRLSPAALETLAIIAYRQPVGRLEVDEIRGVDSGAVIVAVPGGDLGHAVADGLLARVPVEGAQLLERQRAGGGEQRRFKQLREGTHGGSPVG